ncbi:hypothetical protein EXIGLDRAFT_782339 [Exidia glandulosa HHB12029]|uniref:Uncharacterized protein n=1 Tax=Exidia glandulosa HHB12029 TaxID=1314781 RepID=A0A165AV48_EXIGL|nr:hypothetical protein EXIGLDRAFT_782339 [Exidia glandulosa HHB12029]
MPYLDADGQMARLRPLPVVRWLGIFFDPKLTYRAHVDKACAKARKAAMGLRMLANTVRGLSQDHMRRLYIACILPMLTYVSAVWRMQQQWQVQQLQRVQNLCLRMICAVFRTSASCVQWSPRFPPLPSVMSGTATFIFSTFGIGTAKRVSSTNATTNQASTHLQYRSHIEATSGKIPCVLYVWAGLSRVPLPVGTVVIIYAAPNKPVQVNVLSMWLFPGDVSLPTYEDTISNFDNPWLLILGTATMQTTGMADHVSCGFTMSAADCRFNGSVRRWANTPGPFVNSMCLTYGPVHGRVEGLLSLNISNISLNVGPRAAQQQQAASAGSPQGSPTKKRRFAVDEPSAPSAAPSSSAAAVLRLKAMPLSMDLPRLTSSLDNAAEEEVTSTPVPMKASKRKNRAEPVV